jgi:hypothetical protein
VTAVLSPSPLILTDHAVERYQERFTPHLSRAAARAELEVLVAGARPTGHQTRGGEADIWICDGGVRLLVRRDERVGRVVTTVLPPSHSPENASGAPYGGRRGRTRRRSG